MSKFLMSTIVALAAGALGMNSSAGADQPKAGCCCGEVCNCQECGCCNDCDGDKCADGCQECGCEECGCCQK